MIEENVEISTGSGFIFLAFFFFQVWQIWQIRFVDRQERPFDLSFLGMPLAFSTFKGENCNSGNLVPIVQTVNLKWNVTWGLAYDTCLILPPHIWKWRGKVKRYTRHLNQGLNFTLPTQRNYFFGGVISSWFNTFPSCYFADYFKGKDPRQ